MLGGFSEENPVDEEVSQLVNSLRNVVESRMNTQYHVFEPISFTCQLVAGTNYEVRVRVGDEQYISVNFFQPLPCYGTELELTDVNSL